MPPPSLPELDRLADCLAGLVADHRRLLDLVGRQAAAMRTMDAAAIDDLVARQEDCRTSIARAEARRRVVVAAIARAVKLPADPTLTRLAATFPGHRTKLLAARDELRALAAEIKQRTAVSGRVAQSLLGHLNTAVRLIAGAVERGGVYTRNGTPKLTRRMGSIEAVG
ncbi:MAG: hypothetical protein JWO31_354 [Phycisphaerales bacterium]|nr:hypothetical protein [Phycisphaerales bacterium]